MTLPTTKNNERGFTIVELLIVIIVIGILAALVLVAYSNVQAQARDTKRQGNAASVRDAAAAYKSASTLGYYPRNTTSGTPATSDFLTDVSTAANYSGGQQIVNLDSSVTGLIVTNAALVASGTPDNIYVAYCPTPGTSTYQNATGVKIGYYKETGTAGVQYTFTGTTC